MRQSRSSLLAGGLACAAALGAPAPAAAYDAAAYRLLDFFQRVCVGELPEFESVPDKLASVGFDVVETLPGVFEARSLGSAYTVFVTPASEAGAFASCALSVEGTSRAAAREALDEFVYDRFAGSIAAEPDGAGGVQYRILGVEPQIVFVAAGGAVGAAMSVEVDPIEGAAQ